MQDKALRLLLSISVSLVFVLNAGAQNLTRSPYSIIGIGETQFQGTSLQSSMGQTGQGIRRPSDINILNPASYSALKYTVIEGGILYSQGTLTQNAQKSNIDNSSFTYFMIGLPVSVKHKMGLVFGLSPYSSIGYKVSTTTTFHVNNDPAAPGFDGTTLVEGTGGLSKFNLGFGAQVIKGVSAGVNLSYIFGQLHTSKFFVIPTQYNMFNYGETRSRIVGGSQLQGGVQYSKDIKMGKKKEAHLFTAGVSGSLGAMLNGKQETFARTLYIGSTVYTKDTVYYSDSEKGAIELPYSISFGVGIEKEKKWSLAADIHSTNWSAYRSFGKSDSLKNSIGFNIGGSYTPNADLTKNYFQRIEYRAGLRYDGGNLVLSDNTISTYAVSLGAGFPLGKTASKLNVTGEYMVKGTTNSNLIREEYFRIIFGINFSDKWFQRSKYD